MVAMYERELMNSTQVRLRRMSRKDMRKKYVRRKRKTVMTNDNNVCASVRLVIMCVCEKAWCERRPQWKISEDDGDDVNGKSEWSRRS